jgi:deoxyribonucleoside regulator
VSESKLTKVVEAAKMYYELDYSQQKIAEKLGVSRPSVSRLLQQAKQEGIVNITIIDPNDNREKLAERLTSVFGLKHCIVTNVPDYNNESIKQTLGETAASYLMDIVKDGDTIGTTWGTTLYHLSQQLQPKNVKNVKVVQLNGGVTYAETNTYASEILNDLSKAFHTVPHFLPLPAVVDHAVVKEAILSDRHIRSVLEMGKEANIALVTVGAFNDTATLVKAGYFTEGDLKVLKNNGAVGDICSRCIDINGELSSSALDERTIGLTLAELKKKEFGILVAGGSQKVEGVYGALAGKYTNVLITDQYTAKTLLEMESEVKLANE